jgi:hypothetical protein
MSQRERGSLTAALAKRPLAKAQELAPAALAESLLLGGSTIQPQAQPEAPPPVPQPVQPDIQPDIQPIVLPPSLLKRKEKKRPRIAWTFKIPPELHQELSEVAEHNDLPMAEIVIEAITLHLKNFPHPQKK